MTKFVRENGVVRNLKTGLRSRELDIKRLIGMGKKVEYICLNTGLNLLPDLVEEDLLGPANPLFKAKKRKCQNCGQKTVNRFRCHDCWTSLHRSQASED